MNTLHILSRFDSYDAVTGVLDLSRHLLNSDCNCIIATSVDPHILELDSCAVKHKQLPLFETNIKNFFVAYKRLKEIIKANNIDIVHTHSTMSNLLAFLVCRHTDRSLVTTCYDFYSKNIFNYAFLLAKKVIIHNESVGNHLINNFNLHRERMLFIRQSLNLRNFHFQGVDQRSKTDLNIGIIPSLLPHNGYEYFLKAMVKVVRIIPYVKIWIISPIPQFRENIKEDLRLWVRRLGLVNYVNFFEISNLDFKILSRLNLLIYTPIAENASTRVLLEARAYGVPVVATHVPGLADVILDNKTGILVSPKDNNALVVAITRILKNFKLSREIVIAARKRIEEESNLDKNVRQLISAYKQIKNKRKILIVSIGKTQNVISSIPALRLLRKEFPYARITVLISTAHRCLLQRCPYIDELVVYDYLSKHRGVFGFVNIVKLLIRNRFDMVFDLTNSFRTHLLSYLSLANKRYGYRNRFLRFLINHSIKKPAKSLGLVGVRLAILSLLGTKVKDNRLELWPSQEDMEFADNFLKDIWIGKEKIVGVDVTSKRSLFKDPRALNYLAFLCNVLASQHMRLIFIGLKDNLNIKNELFKRVRFKPISVTGDISATQLACLIKKCNIYISSNPDSLYVAIAMKTPSIILSTTRNKFDFSPYKNIEVLTNQDLYLDMKSGSRGRRFTEGKNRDKVNQIINRLIQIK